MTRKKFLVDLVIRIDTDGLRELASMFGICITVTLAYQARSKLFVYAQRNVSALSFFTRVRLPYVFFLLYYEFIGWCHLYSGAIYNPKNTVKKTKRERYQA